MTSLIHWSIRWDYVTSRQNANSLSLRKEYTFRKKWRTYIPSVLLVPVHNGKISATLRKDISRASYDTDDHAIFVILLTLSVVIYQSRCCRVLAYSWLLTCTCQDVRLSIRLNRWLIHVYYETDRNREHALLIVRLLTGKQTVQNLRAKMSWW